MALRTTGVTGMLVQDDQAHNCTIMRDDDPKRPATKPQFIVVDNHDDSIVSYDTTFAVWINQRRFVRVFKKLKGSAPLDLTRVKIDPLMVADLKKLNGPFKIYDHKAFVEKMDAPRSKAILAAFQAQETAASAAA